MRKINCGNVSREAYLTLDSVEQLPGNPIVIVIKASDADTHFPTAGRVQNCPLHHGVRHDVEGSRKHNPVAPQTFSLVS